MFSLSLVLHVIAGFVALITLWLPLFFRKGEKYHRLTGWIFTASMFLISGTSVHMAFYRIWFDPDLTTEQFSFYLFLTFIAILSFATAMYGLRVLKFKQHEGEHRYVVDWLIPSVLLISAVAMSVYGFIVGEPLLAWFPIVGMFLSISHMLYWWRRPSNKESWVIEHLTGMLSCGISTVTAFVVFGAPRVFAMSQAPIWLWFAPTIVLVPLIVYFTIREKQKWQARTEGYGNGELK
jgi:uncharacterized membrane protein